MQQRNRMTVSVRIFMSSLSKINAHRFGAKTYRTSLVLQYVIYLIVFTRFQSMVKREQSTPAVVNLRVINNCKSLTTMLVDFVWTYLVFNDD